MKAAAEAVREVFEEAGTDEQVRTMHDAHGVSRLSLVISRRSAARRNVVPTRRGDSALIVKVERKRS